MQNFHYIMNFRILVWLIAILLIGTTGNTLGNNHVMSITYKSTGISDMSAQFLNSSAIPLSPLADVDRADLANYTATINFDPQTSNYTVQMTISFRNPVNELHTIPLNHWLLSFTDEFLSSAQKNDRGIYPNGFDDIFLQYGNISVNGSPVNYSIVLTHLELFLNSTNFDPIPQGEIVTISMEFNADVPNSARRYAKLIGQDGSVVYAMPHILPLLPVYEEGLWRADPFDFRGEPFYSEASFFRVEVITPIDFVYGATGHIVSEQTDNGTKTRIYEAYPVRDWAMVGSLNYEMSEGIVALPSGREVSIKSFYLSGDSAFGIEQKRYGVEAIAFFSRETGVEYPYDDYVLAQVVSVFYGGMEYPQLVLNAASSSGVVVHETGHQWNWGIIGMDQPHETWLDEGLTSFWTDEFHVFDGTETRQSLGNRYNKAYIKDFKQSPDIINHTIYNSTDYVLMSYYKMPAVLHDLQHLIGDDLFKLILKNFYRENRFGIGKSTEMIDEFAQSLNGDWIYDYFDAFLNTHFIPHYKTKISVLKSNATFTTVQVNFTDFWPGVPQRIELDTSAFPAPFEKSILVDGNISGVWEVESPYFEDFYFDPLRQNLATYNQRYYYVPPLYPSEPSTRITTTSETENFTSNDVSSTIPSESRLAISFSMVMGSTIMAIIARRKKAIFSAH
ncbi:MAG: hypothetical protein D6732_07110 [Methanobacteriota archaeon]|nr:MAG: hypothetical protein D6732_07110 [Euryarchaeota archaeon]